MINKMTVKFSSISENEAFARNVIASFLLPINPAVDELSDVKTAVSEAVTNCVVHGYPNGEGEITLSAEVDGELLHIEVVDNGVGIENVKEAMQPFYTTRYDDERSGMGFAIIKAFTDKMEVRSEVGKGTTVEMFKRLSKTCA